MEEMVRQVIRRYRQYAAEAKMLEQMEKLFHDTSRRTQYDRLQIKLTILNCFLGLLNEDERFVVRRHIVDGIDMARVHMEFLEKWGGGYAKTQRALTKLETEALRKIGAFWASHIDTGEKLFASDTDTSGGDGQ